jgi:hypothetical protein
MLFLYVNVYLNVVLCFVGFACIHECINVLDAWINSHVICCSFMGLLPLGFLLYVSRIFNLILILF